MSQKLIKYLIFDIEGTTTPISFVHNVLFPYIRNNLLNHLKSGWSNPSSQVLTDARALYTLSVKDIKNNTKDIVPILNPDEESVHGVESIISSIYGNVIQQMDQDRKSTELKQLQGHMWSHAYEAGLIHGIIFDDVYPFMKSVHDAKIQDLYIYSSGSVEAQKLLFKHTLSVSDDLKLKQQQSTNNNNNDNIKPINMLPLFKNHFDTTIGSKIETKSYNEIIYQVEFSYSSSTNAPPEQPVSYLFVTDSQKEAIAAKQAGFSVALSVRPGNPPLDPTLPTQSIPQITSFDQLPSLFNLGFK